MFSGPSGFSLEKLQKPMSHALYTGLMKGTRAVLHSNPLRADSYRGVTGTQTKFDLPTVAPRVNVGASEHLPAEEQLMRALLSRQVLSVNRKARSPHRCASSFANCFISFSFSEYHALGRGKETLSPLPAFIKRLPHQGVCVLAKHKPCKIKSLVS